MTTLDHIQEHFRNATPPAATDAIGQLKQKARHDFVKFGLPVRHEEWKYTRITNALNQSFKIEQESSIHELTAEDIASLNLPKPSDATQLVFVNGRYNAALSSIKSPDIDVLPLEEAAAGEYGHIVSANLGHSAAYHTDGINALNTAVINGGLFICVKKGRTLTDPLIVYNIADARSNSILSQPRSLVYLQENSRLQMVEMYATLGTAESFTNQVIEVVVDKDAHFEYYKIQQDASHTNQVSTTHIRQVAKSFIHTVTVSLSGNIVRNNLNIVMDAPFCEAHLYGLYFLQGNTHVDNHTLVDNAQPNCFSNELYKGIMDDQSVGVFNGKIMVQRLAQKTNAYQSNKNILLSDNASVNTKPQLEIFADDVKCSHGCTIGKLDEEGMFYLRSRGIREDTARSLLLQAFASDILDQIKLDFVKEYVVQLLQQRLEFNEA